MDFQVYLTRSLYTFVLILGLAAYVVQTQTLRRVGAFTIKSPAFTTLYKDSDATTPRSQYNLIISTFAGPSIFSSSDSVQLVRRVGTFMDNVDAIVPEMVTKDVTWPNEISAVPGMRWVFCAFFSFFFSFC